MKIDTKKLAEYSTIQYDFSRVAEGMYRLIYEQATDEKSIESMFEAMKQWTPEQVDELFDENGDLNMRLYGQATRWLAYSDELGTMPLFLPGDSPYKRVNLVQLCRWLVNEALLGIFEEQCIFNLKDTMFAHHSGFAGSYKLPTDLVKLSDDFVSKEFILNAFDSETCWIEFE